jgi:hypothetical protein
MFCSTIGYNTSYSQTINVPRTISTPYGPRTINVPTTFRTSYGNNRVGETELTTQKHNYTIVLLNSDSLKTRNKLEIGGLTHQIIYKHSNGEISLYQPKDTRELFYIGKGGQKISGIPWNGYWLFKTISGKINVFSSIPDAPFEYVSAIQKGDSEPILEYTLDNVLDLLEGNEKATKLAVDGELLKAIKLYNGESLK